MIKKSILFFVIFFVGIGLVNSVSAADDRQPKTVSGKVFDQHGIVIENAQVQIQCGSTVLNDTTTRYGNYSVVFNEGECVQFDTVSVSAVFEDLYGSTNRTVSFAKGVGMDDIQLVQTATSVPEFGFLSAILASSISLLTYSKIKRVL